jgi:S1-C subfamily serine protease
MMRILLHNLAPDSLEAIQTAFHGQGYELLTRDALSAEEVFASSPDVLITEGSPSDLACCALITQLKSRPGTESSPRIVMIVRGDALERARALDLGADDVISFPFDAAEFAARIRTQIRTRQPAEELRTMLKYAVQREHYADVAVESLTSEEKRRAWLIPAIFVFGAVAVLAALVTVIFVGRTRKDTLQLRAEIARLNSGLGYQSDLLRRAQETRSSIEQQARSADAARASLQAESEDLRKKMASADAADAASLKQQLLDTQNRLKLLENEGKFAETVVRNYGPSVCLLHVVVEFLDKTTGKPILVVTDAGGRPRVDQNGMVQLDTEGSGPHLRIDVFGTGFLVARDGRLVTNHHVAEPWWNNDDLKPLIDHGAAPYVLSYRAYFPGKPEGLRANLDKISSQADVAILKVDSPPPGTSLLELDSRRDASVTGDPVVLIGYPTGIEGILARAGSDVAEKIAESTQNVNQVMTQLATQKLIRPTTTQGHIGDVLKDKIVYDAATTSGGSGGPLFNRNGKVVGINFAVLSGFGGSNLAVPARYAGELLK